MLPNALEVSMLDSFDNANALNNSPILNGKIALPKYPIIVAENNLLIFINSIDLIINCHLIARTITDRINRSMPMKIQVILEELK
jgi:hypothetical protein